MQSPLAYEHNPEIERTFMLEKRHKAQETSPNMDAGAAGQRRALWDFITPETQGISLSIARPTMEVNNLELRPCLHGSADAV